MKYNKLIFSAIVIFAVGCADLNTENLNRGTIDKVLANTDDFVGVVDAQFVRAWAAAQNWQSSNALTFGTLADVQTSSWGNFGMRDLASEPRVAINNTQTYNYAYVLEYAYEANYGVAGAVNDVLRLMKAAEDAGEPLVVKDQNGDDVTMKTKSKALYMQALAFGNLALTYDKAKFVDENVSLEAVSTLPFSTYAELMTEVLAKLELAITTANSAPDFTVTIYNGLSLSKADWVQLLRSTQAKFMVYNSRDNTENGANDWAQVLAYANAGVTYDFAPNGDGNFWWDPYKYYGTEEGWARADYRVVNAMDVSQPSRFPTDGSHPLPASVAGPGVDNRLFTDFVYMSSIPFRAERGLYHYSHYDHIRYDYHYPGGTGSMPQTLKAENDLIIAEALIRTNGDKNAAATLINNTRVTRGGLTAVTGADTDADLLEAIMHERYVELFATQAGQPFYDRRRTVEDNGSFSPYSGLQPLTPHQMPIPAKELNILGEALYTFGGANN